MHETSYAAAALFGILAALCGGVLFALPSLRVQGFHLGFVTLSAAIVFPEILVALNDWTNGINGISLSFTWLKESGALGVSPLSLMIAATGAGALMLQVGLRRTVLGVTFVAGGNNVSSNSIDKTPDVVVRYTYFDTCSRGR